MLKVSAVRDYLKPEEKLAMVWFPSIFIPQINMWVRPENWIEVFCPDGFKNPDLAIQAGLNYLNGD